MEVEETIGDAAYGDGATRQTFADAGYTLMAKVRGKKKRQEEKITLHPQEALLQQARALEHSEVFAGYQKRRQVSEHRLARLVQLGIRQARYFGRTKTLFQLLMAATVANLTLVATKMGMMKSAGCRAFSVVFSPAPGFTVFLKASSAILHLGKWKPNVNRCSFPRELAFRLVF
jgi:hypothetical protein